MCLVFLGLLCQLHPRWISIELADGRDVRKISKSTTPHKFRNLIQCLLDYETVQWETSLLWKISRIWNRPQNWKQYCPVIFRVYYVVLQRWDICIRSIFKQSNLIWFTKDHGIKFYSWKFNIFMNAYAKVECALSSLQAWLFILGRVLLDFFHWRSAPGTYSH